MSIIAKYKCEIKGFNMTDPNIGGLEMLVEITPFKEGKPVEYNFIDELPEIKLEEEINGTVYPIYLTLADCVYIRWDKEKGYKLELNRYGEELCNKYEYDKISLKIVSVNLLTTILEDEISTSLSELEDFFKDNNEHIYEVNTKFVWSHLNTA